MDDDRKLLERFLAGDESAFESIVVHHEATLRRLAYGVLRDAALAEDVAQETFLTAHRRARSYRGEGSVKSWLCRIALNRARDELRRRKRRPETQLPDGLESTAEPQRGAEARWDLSWALSKLRAEHRIALLLREVEGMGYREISETLGWPLGTVQTRVHRARLELRQALEKK
jgi:RNA polymerase sigma-70 factor (ECF subfamily)